MNIDRATAAQATMKHRKPKSGPPVRSSEIVQPARPATLRNRRRWDAYIRCADSYPDLTFKEWLISPCFEDSRNSCG